MSWIKSALAKAAEAGGKNMNLTKTVRTYAGSVYLQAGQAVAGGAKIVQDRLVTLSTLPALPLATESSISTTSCLVSYTEN